MSNQQERSKLSIRINKNNKYPDTSSGVLFRLKKQSNVTPHLPHHCLSLVPQQLYPRHRHLRRRFARKPKEKKKKEDKLKGTKKVDRK